MEEINQKVPHGGHIGYGNSFLDFFCQIESFRLHARLFFKMLDC